MEIHETRRQNLALLAQALGSLAEINVCLGKDRKAPYLYAIISQQKRKDGTFQVAGEKLCRRIEHALGLPLGWMSQEHPEGTVPPISLAKPSMPSESLNVQPLEARTPVIEGGVEILLPRSLA